MSRTRLKELTGQSPILSFKEDSFWVIPDQYIGLEMELENYSEAQVRKYLKDGAPFWVQHNDGSLRNGTEFVLDQAMMGTTLRQAIDYFFTTFTKYEASPRTSIHVHLNMRQENETVEGLRNLIVLYYMYEDAFFQIADINRKWCSYCNPFEDTPPRILEVIMNEQMPMELMMGELRLSAQTNQNRYYGLNLNALNKFGTVEFRHFPLVHDQTRLVDWINLIMELKLAATTMADEGLYPWQVFTTPDEITKLLTYMPKFGGLLLSHSDAARAFTRMSNVRTLSIREVESRRGISPDHVVFKNFLDKSGVKAKTPATPKRKPPVERGQADTLGIFGRIEPQRDMFLSDADFERALEIWTQRRVMEVQVTAAPPRAQRPVTIRRQTPRVQPLRWANPFENDGDPVGQPVPTPFEDDDRDEDF